MLINGKSDNIIEEDMLSVAEKSRYQKSDEIKSIEQVRKSVSKRETFTSQTNMLESNIKRIKNIFGVYLELGNLYSEQLNH